MYIEFNCPKTKADFIDYVVSQFQVTILVHVDDVSQNLWIVYFIKQVEFGETVRIESIAHKQRHIQCSHDALSSK